MGGPTKTVSGSSGLALLARAALPSVPVIGQLPGVRKSREPFAGLTVTRSAVTIERDHVDRYAEVCGFARTEAVPLTYPHMLAAPLHVAIMGDPGFPAPAMGTVHLENSITRHARIAVGDTLDVATSVSGSKPHPKGTTYDFVTEVYAGDILVWESVSTYLRRGSGDDSASWGMSLEDVPPSGPVFPLAADLGRRYAAVSGDYNPIHLYPLTAKALGFPRHIAHGMWTKARCVAVLENRLPKAVRVEVGFRKPAFLPGSAAFGSRPVADGYAFSLSKRGNPETVHLLGRTQAL